VYVLFKVTRLDSLKETKWFNRILLYNSKYNPTGTRIYLEVQGKIYHSANNYVAAFAWV